MSTSPQVAVLMGSESDWQYMSATCELLAELGIPYEARVISAHRTPDVMTEYAKSAEKRGLSCIITGAGGAAHVGGMIAAMTLVPVLGVPIPSTSLNGLDSLLSIVQMPGGVTVGTLAIGKPGATNAAVLAAEIIGLSKPEVRARLQKWRDGRRDAVMKQTLPQQNSATVAVKKTSRR